MPAIDPQPFLCGLDATLQVVGGKWKPLILYFLESRPMRFSELKRSVRGVSDKVLAQQLRELELHSVVARTDHQEVPPRVGYSLTAFGESLVESMRPMCSWGERNAEKISEALAQGGNGRRALT